METTVCNICSEIKGVQGIDIPYKLTKNPAGISFKHLDLCPEHLARALSDVFQQYTATSKEAVRIGNKVLSWVERDKEVQE